MGKPLVRTGMVVALLSVGVLEPLCLFASDRTAIVPPVTDKPVRAAVADINAAGLLPVVRSIVNPQRPINTIIGQNPAPGTQAVPHTQVILNVSGTELAIQPGTTVDEATGQTRVWGQLIVQRAFTLDLKSQTQHVPLLVIAYQGREYVRGDEVDPLRFAEDRTVEIAERLSVAWRLLDSGGTLEVAGHDSVLDSASIWHLTDPLGPQYGRAEPQFPAIRLRHPSLGGNSLRILTVYPEDAAAFGQPDDANGVPTQLTPRELADYLVALLEAHHVLFHKQSPDLESYDRLEICKTKDGRIFREIASQARQARTPERRSFRDVLDQLSMDQRMRLATLAYKAPTDWRLRNRF
jgi:hypothetical protein